MTDDTVEEIKRRKLEAMQSGDTPPAPEAPVDVEGEAHFQELIESHPVVLVDYHAEWCGPCHQLKPIVERIAAETSAVVAAVDIDHHRELAMGAGVRSVPTLALYANGEQVERLVGVQPFERLQGLIDAHAA